jgi:hypothetical protein
MPTVKLKQKYQDLYDTGFGTQRNRTFIIRKIAYRLQALEYGAISDTVKTELERFIKENDPISKLVQSVNAKSSKNHLKKDRRLPIPGTVINRKYKNQDIQVKVLEKGFEYNNKKYRSLSAIANEITGTHLNGYVFFGM